MNPVLVPYNLGRETHILPVTRSGRTRANQLRGLRIAVDRALPEIQPALLYWVARWPSDPEQTDHYASNSRTPPNTSPPTSAKK